MEYGSRYNTESAHQRGAAVDTSMHSTGYRTDGATDAFDLCSKPAPWSLAA